MSGWLPQLERAHTVPVPDDRIRPFTHRSTRWLALTRMRMMCVLLQVSWCIRDIDANTIVIAEFTTIRSKPANEEHIRYR